MTERRLAFRSLFFDRFLLGAKPLFSLSLPRHLRLNSSLDSSLTLENDKARITASRPRQREAKSGLREGRPLPYGS